DVGRTREIVDEDKEIDENILSTEDERLIKRMNEKGIDSSKDQMVKEESKE
ncbi:hypothetical protein Tco_0042816, partial [Tanacetum coccineum]